MAASASFGLAGAFAAIVGGATVHAAGLGNYAGPHSAPKAKHVILLFMTGGPSQVDMFDPKPALDQVRRRSVPSAVDLRTERTTAGLLPSPFEFKQARAERRRDERAAPADSPRVVDDLCVIRSMSTDNPNHDAGARLFHDCGSVAADAAVASGSWITYGLGTENQNLPGLRRRCAPGGRRSAAALGSGFLPGEYQGTTFDDQRSGAREDDPPTCATPTRRGGAARAARLAAGAEPQPREALRRRTRSSKAASSRWRRRSGCSSRRPTPSTSAASREQSATSTATTPFGNGCLLARRLVERGVRFVQVYYGAGQPWDDHEQHRRQPARALPRHGPAVAALIRDLKRRGLLDDTLVVWGGEFGRTPVSESGDGRDHNPYGFTMWLAGGGVKGGMAYGATDEFGFKAVENRVTIHDLHATMLHLLGIDHEKLTYRYAGRDFRLTDVSGESREGPPCVGCSSRVAARSSARRWPRAGCAGMIRAEDRARSGLHRGPSGARKEVYEAKCVNCHLPGLRWLQKPELATRERRAA